MPGAGGGSPTAALAGRLRAYPTGTACRSSPAADAAASREGAAATTHREQVDGLAATTRAYDDLLTDPAGDPVVPTTSTSQLVVRL